MSRSAKLRLAFLGGALLLLTVLIAGAAWIAAREFGSLHREFDKVQRESFRIADQLVSSVARLNSELLSFEASGEAHARVEFERASHALDAWIDAQYVHLQTPEERVLLDRINAEYDVYLAEARELI